jgi:hypothetical protein
MIEEAMNERLEYGDTQSQQPDQSAPQGVDPSLWQHMTPEERALWQ